MKLKKCLLNFSVTIITIQLSVQDAQNAEVGLAKKFALPDDTDKFTRVTLAMSELLETCESLDIKRFGLIRDHVGHTRLSRTFLHTFTLVQMKYLVLDGNELFVPLRLPSSLYRTKLSAFIVIAFSNRSLEYMLKRLRNTKWQNSEGLYIILDSFTVKSGCENAESYLRYTWELNILHAVFFCLDFSGDIFIYTHNPFTNRAPQPWQEVETFKNKSRSTTWTLFKRKLIRDEMTCADLMFDKASQLDGYKYKILAVNVPPAFSVNVDPTKGVTYSGMDAKIHLSFIQHLNASATLTMSTGVGFGWFETNGVGHDLLGNISRGEYDILGNNLYNFNKYQATMTYPHRYTGLAIITKSAGWQTGQAKIVHFMNPKVIGAIAVVYVLTILVLGILNRYGITTAFLEITRLTTNASMTRRIERTPLRIYLFPVFLLFLISNATFQGKLSAILTRPIVKPNIDSLEDLQSSDMQIYAGLDYRDAIDKTLLPNLKIVNYWNCSRYVINNESTACLADRYELMKIVVDGGKHHLYLSSQDILSLTSAYVVKRFWPLRQKLDEILSRLFTSGILDLWKQQDAQIFMQSYQMYRAVLNDRSFRILKLQDLKFAFVQLTIGLGCSICVFVIECMISCYKRNRNRNNTAKNKSNNTVLSFVE